MSGRSRRAFPPPVEREETPALQPCVFCVEGPAEATGHEGLSQELARYRGARTYLTVTCTFCGVKWVRRRLKARSFEWLRVAE
jgi:hypothetical protein